MVPSVTGATPAPSFCQYVREAASIKPDERRQSSLPAGALQGIRDSARRTVSECGFIDRETSRSEMIREFLGVGRDGAPVDNLQRNGEGLFSILSRTSREILESILKSDGFIGRTTPRPEMIQVTLGLGRYAPDPTEQPVMLSAGARIAQFCSSLMQQEPKRAMRAHSASGGLDILA